MEVNDIPDGAAQAILPQIIGKLREVTRPPGQRGLWLDNLNDLELVKVFIMIKEGRKSSKIVETIQSYGYQTLEPRSMNELLLKFKERTMGEVSSIFAQGKKLRQEEKQIAVKAKSRLDRVNKKIDDVWVLNHLIDEQLERYHFWKKFDLNSRGNTDIGKQVDRIVDSIRGLVRDRFDILVRLGSVSVRPTETTRIEVNHIHALALKSIEDVQGVVEITSQFSDDLEALAITAPETPLLEASPQNLEEIDDADFSEVSSGISQ